MLGQRQNLAAQLISSGGSYTFTVDREFPVYRIKLWTPTAAPAAGDAIQITAEGEGFYTGNSVPIMAVGVSTDDALTSGVRQSPHVIAFDRPIILSKDYPLTIKLTSASNNYWVVLEGA